MKINDKSISILAFLLCMLFASSEAYTQNGFVFAGGDYGNGSSTYSIGQMFYNNQETADYYINEGLQQSFLYHGVDSVVVLASEIPYEYRPQYFINQVGDTTLYLLPTYGIDSLVAVTLYSVVCPLDTTATAGYSHYTHPVTLLQPTVYPIGSQEVSVRNNAPAEFPVGETTIVRWVFRVGNHSTTSCNQQVVILFPPCDETVNPTDADGNLYHAVRVGYHCWTKENLRSTHYDDGLRTPIPVALIYKADMYPDTMENLNRYGRLYSWYSAVNIPENDNVTQPIVNPTGYVQGLCPQGWRLPTPADINSINGIAGVEGLRADTLWIIPGNNVTGFSALPAGIYLNGQFMNLRGNTYFCTYNSQAIVPNTTRTHVGHLTYACPDILMLQCEKRDAVSVRCIKE